MLKLSVPSLLYTVQNNLLYYALSHLDAATFQVGYQVKILTTAFFSMFLLGKSLTRLQWISLIILTIGVSLAQLAAHENKQEHENTTAGFIAVLLAACTSGFSGVWFERILKGSSSIRFPISSTSIEVEDVCRSKKCPDKSLRRGSAFALMTVLTKKILTLVNLIV